MRCDDLSADTAAAGTKQLRPRCFGRPTAVLLARAATIFSCACSLSGAWAATAIPSGTLSSPISTADGRTRAALQLRRSRQPAKQDGTQQEELVTATSRVVPRGRHSGSPVPAWLVVAQTARGGAFGRKRAAAAASSIASSSTPEVVGGKGGEEDKGVEDAGAGGDDVQGEAEENPDEEELGQTGGASEEEGERSASGGQVSDDEDARMSSASSHDSSAGDSDHVDDATDERGEEEEEEEHAEEAEEEDVGEGGTGEGSQDGHEEKEEGEESMATATKEAKGPTAPLFSFPPGPRVDRTKAEESLQEVLPMQQRLVKYLTEDRVFGAQILCSLYFLASTVAYWVDGDKFSGCYQAALMSLTIKQWGTVLGRVRRVLVPHLLYEPQSRYVKYRARVAALALDPAIQGIVYCGIFTFMPLSAALIPLLLKELVYMLWVLKEVLQIAAPGLVGMLTTLCESPLSVLMTAGDVDKWRDTPDAEKRLLLGRRLAQASFKIEMMLPFSVALRVLPGVIKATLGGSGCQPAGAVEGVRSAGGCGQIARMLPLVKVAMMMMAYVKLLTVRNAQLEDDVRILKGLKIRGYNCEWVEQTVDSVVFGKMVGCPWWVGVLMAGFATLPNHEATKEVMASEHKLRTMGMTLLNLAIGRTPGADDDDDAEEDETEGDGKEGDGDESSPPSKMAKVAKVAAVATGLTDF